MKKNKTKFTCLLVATAVIFLFSFTALADDLQTVVNDNSNFGFDLYQKLKAKKGNLFFSPYSISTALAMTYIGARGQTAKEMAEVLHFSLSQELLHPSFFTLQSHLNAIESKGNVKLSIANSLWAQDGYHFLNPFLDLNKKYYGAGVKFVDFEKETETARKTINCWVEDKTQQKIKELIKPKMLNSSTTLVLCNAIYFKGNWQYKFDKKRTIVNNFHISPDKIVKVPMMNQSSRFKFKQFRKFSAIEFPYTGNDLSMIMFLPKKQSGLAQFEKCLTNDNVKNWMNELANSSKAKIFVSFPKFSTTSEFELKDILTEMGMPNAFSNADFSGMTGKRDLFISKVIHKAFVNIDEAGTEAAASTAVVMGRSMSRLLTFRADHPFVFLIRENKTGTVLFIGRIINPTK